MKRHVSFLLIAAALLAGCSMFQWSGYGRPEDHKPAGPAEPAAPPAGDSPGVTPPGVQAPEKTPFAVDASSAAPAPKAFSEAEMKALYYYDLGPAEIDVSEYPKDQQANFAVFGKACAQCHTLARAVNSPRRSRTAWHYYIYRMRLRQKFKSGTGFTKKEAKMILDFLAYDSQVRKVKRKDDFKAHSRDLEKRFNRILQERMSRLQEGARLAPADQK